MKKFLSIILAAAILFSMATLFASAEDTEVTLGTLASVTTTSGSFHTIDAGDAIFSNRTYTFGESLPSYLVGKPYVQTKIADSVSATVETDGYVYVITQVDGVTDSQEAALVADGFAKIDTIPAATLWSAHKYEVAVMAKNVKAGDTVSFGIWGILIADFAMNDLASVASTNGSFSTVQKDNTVFSNRTYTFGDIPNCLIGHSYLQTGISSDVLATVTGDGFVYILTQVDGTSNSQEATLTSDGFTKVATLGAGILWSAHKYEVAVMAKEVKAGDTISYSYWGVLLANEGEEKFELNALATVMPIYETYGTIAAGEQIFTDRTTHLFAETVPEFLVGKTNIPNQMIDMLGTE